ncbi:MAG: hypothetical protein Fues2KO_44960 [Fuerstiella sp.]
MKQLVSEDTQNSPAYRAQSNRQCGTIPLNYRTTNYLENQQNKGEVAEFVTIPLPCTVVPIR